MRILLWYSGRLVRFAEGELDWGHTDLDERRHCKAGRQFCLLRTDVFWGVEVVAYFQKIGLNAIEAAATESTL